MKKKHVLLKVLLVIAAIVALFLLGVRGYFRLSVRDYYKASEKGFIIPDCGKDFIAQGLDYDETEDLFFITGYMKDGSASPVYTVSPADRKHHKTVRLLNTDGTIHTGHAGGIAVGGEYVFIAGGHDNCLYVFSKNDILNAADGAEVTCLGTFSLEREGDEVGVAFVYINEGKLIAGEFYRNPNYETPESHKLTTPSGDYNQALAVAFELDSTAEYGINPVPVAAYSLPDQVQGMATENGRTYLSISYGVAFSHILVYDNSRLNEGTIELLGENVPLYYCDSASLTEDNLIAPMSEEIVFKDGLLYTMCESASNKYIFGKFTSAKWCYATKVR